MPPTATPAKFTDKYIAYLRKVCEDPGARANLRRAARLTPDQALTAHRYLSTWTAGAGVHREAVLYQVAAWVAQYDKPPSSAATLPLGKALAAATCPGGRAQVSQHSAETRLTAIARSSADAALYQHMPRILSTLASTGQPIDFATLTGDLLSWPTRSAATTKKWLGDFYRFIDAATSAKTDTP